MGLVLLLSLLHGVGCAKADEQQSASADRNLWIWWIICRTIRIWIPVAPASVARKKQETIVRPSPHLLFRSTATSEKATSLHITIVLVLSISAHSETYQYCYC